MSGKPKLIFDIDGIILDLQGRVISHWNSLVANGMVTDQSVNIQLPTNPATFWFGFSDHQWENIPQVQKEYYDLISQLTDLELLEHEIPSIMAQLRQHYHIILISAFEYPDKRISNLKLRAIPHDVLYCDIQNKVVFLRDQVFQDDEYPVAFFEDRPSTIAKYLENFPGVTIYSPARWKYLEHLKDNPTVKLYNSANEWLSLIQTEDELI